MRHIPPSLSIILLVIICCPALSQKIIADGPGNRVALVIGNSDYASAPLLNPGNDARAMARALRNTGFEVMEHIDMENKADMKRVIREFGKKLQNGEVGLFYYAGHGIQVDGKNYLIPTKAEIYAEEEVEYESVDVGFVLSQMEIANIRMNIIILDACRNNPFARSWRSAGSGLAFINAPTGTLIAYSTAPGSVASDGTGSNGLYTEELLKQISVEGLKIEDVFKNVRSEVLDKSNKMQTPWESSSLVGDFYFTLPGTRVLPTPDRVEWKKESLDQYFFYRDGSDITEKTTGTTANHDLILFDRSTGRNYLLEDFSNVPSGVSGKPVPLHSASNAFWRRNEGNSLWFYHEGTDITKQINIAYYGNNLVTFNKQTGRYYALYDYATAKPGNLYPAVYTFSPNNTLWWADEKYHFLYVDGIQIAARTWFQFEGNDLIIHDPEGSSSFLIRELDKNRDQALRPAEILFRPGLITCTRDEDNKFYPYRDNQPYFNAMAAGYSDRDLLVYDTLTNQHYTFEDFLDKPAGTHIVGRIIYSPTDAIWKRTGSTYYLYIKGKLQTSDMTHPQTEYNDDDLEVTELSTGIVWILPDYRNQDENTLVPAEIKQ